MTTLSAPHGKLELSWRKPWWLLVLGLMLGFGLVQEQSKIKVNHYLQVGDAEQFWDQNAQERESWWQASAPVGQYNFYVSRETWTVFHSFSRGQLGVQVGTLGVDYSFFHP